MSQTDYVVWFIFMGVATATILFVAVGVASGAVGRHQHPSQSSALTPSAARSRQPPPEADEGGTGGGSPRARLGEPRPADESQDSA